MKKLVLSLFILCAGVMFAFAQERTITGVVTSSEDGQPIAGATVKVKEAPNVGVSTDANGKFSIKVPERGKTLVFSSISFTEKEITITGNTVNVTLATDSKALGEVVVTALGIKREKKSLGYASQEIKGDVLSNGTTNTGNIAAQLSGKVAGLNVTTSNNFGGSSNLLIRGIKSLQGGNPLIVIDGSPVDNNTTYSYNNQALGNDPASTSKGTGVDFGNALSDINQNDIESINVLKGAAASALYGERGLNGVIVIVTKNGKSKEDGSWGVSLNTGVQISSIDKSTFPTYQNRYGGGYDPSFYSGKDPDGTPYVNFPEDASWGPEFDPNKSVYAWDSFDPKSPNYGKKTPWVAAKNGPITFFETPVTYTNSLSLQKGNSVSNIALNYDNLSSKGLVPNSQLNKNNFSLKLNYNLTDKFRAAAYSNLTLQKTTGRTVSGYSDNTLTGFRQWWQTNVDMQALKDAYYNHVGDPNNFYGNVNWNRNSDANAAVIFWNNPYFQAYQNYASDDRTRSFSYVTLTYDLAKNINLNGKISYDNTSLFIERRLAMGSLAQPFGASGKDIGSGYSRQDVRQSEINYDLFLNYKFDITKDINVSGIVGGNLRNNNYNSIYASTEGGLGTPGTYSLINSLQPTLLPNETVYMYQTGSGYVTASFEFYKWFYLDATWRVDQSSKLPSKNNPYDYPSITGSFILSEFVKPSWLNFWKVRANYAIVGGAPEPYLTKNYYNNFSGFYNGATGAVGLYNSQITLPNADLKPQRAKEFEVGTEAKFLNNRITFDIAYYKTKTFNQPIQLPISSGSGLRFASINAGRIDNSGIEAQLGGVPVKTPDFTWNVNVNWSKNQNKVIR